MVGKHLVRIRQDQGRKASRIFVYVERNLGFEAGRIPPSCKSDSEPHAA
jgi:hypothetical protein